ncbi:terpene cyclase [Steccherinum ochraceum]|uniref:Terpene cyclase n=1 Tax=Steccherinum ochraceum TaxID=92696 RepID=A0A4R0S0V8_9APHY|nr:terpene cyclase [Steccherinum ochraceum]
MASSSILTHAVPSSDRPAGSAPHSAHPRRTGIPPLPDLRFEYSYLRSVRSLVSLSAHPRGSGSVDEKGKGKTVALSLPEESERALAQVVHVQWGMLVWVTVRDQVISPLLQGALWGVASHFLVPARSVLASGVKSWWGSTSLHPNHEGGGVAHLRSWVGGIWIDFLQLGSSEHRSRANPYPTYVAFLQTREDSDAPSEWVLSFNCLDRQAQQAFDACDFSLLASLSYSAADQDVLRFGCDLMNIFFLFDEFSDCGQEADVRELYEITMDAFRHSDKPRPEGEHIVGEVVRQFWQRATACIGVDTQQRFIDAFDRYTASVVTEARDRNNARIRSIHDYLELRRGTVGAEPSFSVIEFGLDLPPCVFEHPVMKNLLAWAVDMLIVTNDMYSFNVEQARGDPHNLLISIMYELNVNIDGAFEWVSAYYRRLSTNFLEVYRSGLPTFGPGIDAQVVKYVDGLARWIRGIDAWSFETQRYFGTEGEEVKRTRTVALLLRHERVHTEGVVSGLDVMEKHSVEV